MNKARLSRALLQTLLMETMETRYLTDAIDVLQVHLTHQELA